MGAMSCRSFSPSKWPLLAHSIYMRNFNAKSSLFCHRNTVVGNRPHPGKVFVRETMNEDNCQIYYLVTFSLYVRHFFFKLHCKRMFEDFETGPSVVCGTRKDGSDLRLFLKLSFQKGRGSYFYLSYFNVEEYR